MPHLTPDYESGTVYRSLNIPVWLLPHVNGALLWLTEVFDWEAFGDMTPQQCADGALAMWDSYVEGNPMLGAIIQYATTYVPANCLACDGGVYLKADYPALYSAIATEFIIDADTFHTPDCEDLVLIGASVDIGEVVGEATHTLSVDEIPNHSHDISNGFGPNVALSSVLGAIEGLSPVPTGETTTAVGTGLAHNNIQPSMKARFCIVAR